MPAHPASRPPRRVSPASSRPDCRSMSPRTATASRGRTTCSDKPPQAPALYCSTMAWLAPPPGPPLGTVGDGSPCLHPAPAGQKREDIFRCRHGGLSFSTVPPWLEPSAAEDDLVHHPAGQEREDAGDDERSGEQTDHRRAKASDPMSPGMQHAYRQQDGGQDRQQVDRAPRARSLSSWIAKDVTTVIAIRPTQAQPMTRCCACPSAPRAEACRARAPRARPRHEPGSEAARRAAERASPSFSILGTASRARRRAGRAPQPMPTSSPDRGRPGRECGFRPES